MNFADVLTLVFITLKLMGYITWSWWWVLAPTWISFVILLLLAMWYTFSKVKR